MSSSICVQAPALYVYWASPQMSEMHSVQWEHFLHDAMAYFVWTVATLVLSRVIWNIWGPLIYMSEWKKTFTVSKQ